MAFEKGHTGCRRKASLNPPETTTFERRSDEIAVTTGRKKRINLNDRQRGGIAGYDPEDPNHPWKYYTANDDPERPGEIERLKEAGWDTVTDGTVMGEETLDKCGRLPGAAHTKPVGSGVTGVLMRKPREECEEDYQAVVQANDRVEQSIFGQLHESGGRYGRVEALGRTEERR